MELVVIGIWLLAFIVCSLLVFFISVYGTKEVSFEENLKATQGSPTVKKAKKDTSAGGGGQKKAKKSVKNAVAKLAADERDGNVVSSVATLEVTEEFDPDLAAKVKKSKKKAAQQMKKANSAEAVGGLVFSEQQQISEAVVEAVEAEIKPLLQTSTTTTKVDEVEVKPWVEKKEERSLTPQKQQQQQHEPEKIPEPKLQPEVVPEFVPEVVPEVVAQQSSSEATPKKLKKPRKIKIEEIDDSIIQVIEQHEPVQVIEQIIEAAAKKSSKKRVEIAKKVAAEPKIDLITLVKKTALDDFEVQQVIDILLTKQSGSGSSNQDWIEPMSGSDKHEAKNLQRQLTEKESLLAEEMAKVKSITDRMNVMRQELNQMKSNQVASQRYIDELQTGSKHAAQNLEARYQAEVDAHQRDVVALQGQIQYHAARAQSLQATLDTMQVNPVQVDPGLYAELENLRASKMSYEAELGNIHNQLGLQQEESGQLQHQLNKKLHQIQDLEDVKAKTGKELQVSNENNKKLSEKVAKMEKKSSSDTENFQDKIEELSRVNYDLESRVTEVNVKCKKATDDLTRMAEENERISEQLTANVERPVAEGQEANGASEPKQNGSHVHKEVPRPEEDLWHKKYLAISQEHEQIVNEKDVILKQMNTVESQYKSQLAKIESDLEEQRAKNNDKEQFEAAIRDSEQAQKMFLQRLLPDVKADNKADNKNKNHSEWLEDFASQVKEVAIAQKAELSAQKAEFATQKAEFATQKAELSTQKAELSTKINVAVDIAAANVDDGSQTKKLEGQVEHYKSVLAETENMLNQLQANVESEETRWRSRLSDKESQLDKIQRDLEAIKVKNAAMEDSLNSLNSAEEMESKLRELQEKLAIEEADKKQLQSKLLLSVDSEEMSRLQQEIDSEGRQRQELDSKVAKMSQLLSTGQEALQQEKKTVEMLRQQLANSPAKVSTPDSTNGGQEEPDSHPNSQVGSVASLDLSDTSSVKKKSKKKKLLGLFK